MRPKPENFVIAVGLAILYFVAPSLAYQVRENFAEPLAKQHSNDELTKIDPETDPIVDPVVSPPIVVPVVPVPIEVDPPVFEKEEAYRLSFLPYISTPGGAPVAPPLDPEVPLRLVIPQIGLNAPIHPARTKVIDINGEKFRQWLVPKEYAAGWHKNSARLGEPGNTVLNGHHNTYGEVFVRLVDLKEGDLILILSESRVYSYVITNKMILPEVYEDLDIRMNNAQWILSSDDERITLITCWPYESNTHRLIVVAKPSTAPSALPALQE